MIRYVNLEEFFMLVAMWLGSEHVGVRVYVVVSRVMVKMWSRQ